jgi:hypothetical protein
MAMLLFFCPCEGFSMDNFMSWAPFIPSCQLVWAFLAHVRIGRRSQPHPGGSTFQKPRRAFLPTYAIYKR